MLCTLSQNLMVIIKIDATMLYTLSQNLMVLTQSNATMLHAVDCKFAVDCSLQLHAVDCKTVNFKRRS
jgi:hypothetical protein